MKLFDVYPLFDIEPVKGEDVYIWDNTGQKYLDLYGGHAVISIGHSHPHYIERITEQVKKIGFYSNSIQNPLQQELATKLGQLSGYDAFRLFLCNSGAEANENALKLASFHTKRSTVLTFKKGFHGRTSAAVAVTDNPKIQAPLNRHHSVLTLEMNDIEALNSAFEKEAIAAVIVEGIQGIAGVYEPETEFLQTLRALCDKYETVLILDEIQSGYGRSGKFFAHQYSGIEPDLITTAKGMGNGFPVGGVLIHPKFEASFGLLGTTFGGNHLACAASLAVLEVMEQENLVENAANVGEYLLKQLNTVPGIQEVRGKGLIIGIELAEAAATLRKKLLFEHKIFTGSSSEPNTMRVLPSLTLKQAQADIFVEALKKELLG
ncbi:aminotransferase class III-fold pyridoxal phosphate-dependent enzyme [Rapidithrix thailandica]|uniref:Aminotransferase class III-fold pyridoxal phosphate-dependent enzyme n=1 Tax=Rapidithrix thailandica TaxID=413964 RepID=A0AAW9S4W6_9BACT